MKYVVSFILIVSWSLISFCQTQDFYPPTAVPDRIVLNLTESPSNSMAVTWRTAPFVHKGYVELVLADASPDNFEPAHVITAQKTKFLSDQNGANYYSAIMDNLLATTQYAYRVGDSTQWSEWIHFKTASDEIAPLSFIYFGDAQNDLKSRWSRAIRGAFQQMPKADFILHAGDLINRRDRDHEWGEWFYAGGWIHGMIPNVSTPGNHEYGRDEAGVYGLSRHWHPTFTLPENGPEGLKETVYYTDYQGLRVISVNTPSFLSSPKDREIQMAWLTEVLQHNDQKWTIVTMHHPIYSTKFGRDNVMLRNMLQPLFEQYKVDMVLQGHDHTYGRGSNLSLGDGTTTTMEGPMYVVSVSGPKMYDLGMDTWMQRGASNTQLYQLIHIDDQTLRFEAYTVDGQLYDAFSLCKQANGRNVYLDAAPKDVEERLALPGRYLEEFTDREMKQFKARFKAYKARKGEK